MEKHKRTKVKRHSSVTTEKIETTSSHNKNSKSTSRFRNRLYSIHEFTLNKEAFNKGALDDSYGFTLAGYCPCHVENVTMSSISHTAGLKQSDIIMKINDVKCCRATLKTCLNLIKNSPVSLSLTVYRFNEPKRIRSSNKSHKAPVNKNIANKKKQNKVFLSRIFRPSLWVPCGMKIKFTGCMLDKITMNQSYYSYPSKSSKNSLSKQSSQLTSKSSSSQIGADTGYETASESAESKIKKLGSVNEEIHDEDRIHLIDNLLETESNFISYLSMGVAQLARPLRGFLMKQQDYFILFQNIEKILIISENFLRSMDKWTSLELYTRIGQLYTQKLNLFREAFTIYVKGHSQSKRLLSDLKYHSKQFRLFVRETQSGNLTLSNLIDLPLVHIQETLYCFKHIKRFTAEANLDLDSDHLHIESVIAELEKILNYSSVAGTLTLEDEDHSITDESLEESEEGYKAV